MTSSRSTGPPRPAATGRAARAGLAAIALCLLLPACRGRETPVAFAPADGDLLFQDLDGSPLCDAIEAVTQGVEGARFSHVGIVTLGADGAPAVIEAYEKVTITPLATFLARSRDEKGRPKVVVGRLVDSCRSSVPSAGAGRSMWAYRPGSK